MKERTNNKKDIFDILRVIAMFLVVMVHLGQNLSFTQVGYIRQVTDLGQYGVEIFFVISGFLIVNSYKKCKSTKNFYKKKICRILPTYYLIITASILFHIFILNDVPADNTNIGFLRYYALINTIIPSNNIFWVNLCASWFIAAILFFYLVFPFINKFVDNFKKSVLTLLGSIAFCKLFLLIYNFIALKIDPSFSGSYFPLKYIYNFMFGVAVYYAIKENKQNKLIMILMLILTIIVFSPLEIIPFIFCIVTTIFIICGQDIHLRNPIVKKIVNILSDYSFDVYLAHALSLEIMEFIIKKTVLNDFIFLILFLIITIFISNISHKLSKKVEILFK